MIKKYCDLCGAEIQKGYTYELVLRKYEPSSSVGDILIPYTSHFDVIRTVKRMDICPKCVEKYK